MVDEPYVTTTLRMPLSMSKEIKHQAIDNHRSVNSELLFRLQQTLDREKAQAKDGEV
ncbi:Arc family DNA-binding protein [Burkholderia cenocepacia]|uniref:Arc family DNA-binding protein n=1 Tax=Burkholderia cenocepacia TaxID=95486 RepID=UPI00285C37D8|nr:Arc family DNA-binding protein [Burkholderia cenocepacia]MDR8026972.1 Arc family DNA-binding protein [Burkholderia cenocepacia]MDR8044224.1 Arc family DNA-binding protein [Burkholderia cenocepacia]